MMKALFVGIWVCLVLTGSVYFFTGSAFESADAQNKPGNYFGGLDYVKIEPMTISVIKDNEVRGYLIIESVFTIEQKKTAELSVPIEFFLRDMIIESVHANPDIDIFRLEKFDLDGYRKNLLEKMNAKLGQKTLYDVLIQKFDFISKEDVRDMQLRRS